LSKRIEAPAHAKCARIVAALWHLLVCDAVYAASGLRGLHWMLVRTRVADRRRADADVIVNAMEWAVCLYFKQVRCLQKSIALAQLLRRCGFDAQVIAAYRLEPFIGHAWVEVERCPVGDFRDIRRSMKFCMAINQVGPEVRPET
jgi:Transglutaminase-like superfamily